MSEIVECYLCESEVDPLNHLVAKGLIYCDSCISYSIDWDDE